MLAGLKARLQPFRLYRAARFGWHFARDPVFRRDHLLLWRRPRNLFQHRSITEPDRYPAIFARVRDHLAGPPSPRLLSFGCAQGDEAFSLRAYFPAASIKGIDINPANIATSRRRQRERGLETGLLFECNDSAAAEVAASYDAVFCMAVFVRWQLKEDPGVQTCAPHLRFADFERAVTTLAACVRPGGLLVVRHAMFRFSDTACARDFTCLLAQPVPPSFFPRFGRDNRRLPHAPVEEVIFLRRTPPR